MPIVLCLNKNKQFNVDFHVSYVKSVVSLQFFSLKVLCFYVETIGFPRTHSCKNICKILYALRIKAYFRPVFKVFDLDIRFFALPT